jgi:hypothetical protein
VRTDFIMLEDSIMPVFSKIETKIHALDPLRQATMDVGMAPLRVTLEHSAYSLISSRSSYKLLYFLGQMGGVIYCLVGVTGTVLAAVLGPVLNANLIEQAYSKEN